MYPHHRITSPFPRFIVAMLIMAILMTGIVSSRPVTEVMASNATQTATDVQKKLAAGLGDTTPTDNTAKSVPVSTRTKQLWLLAPALNPESIRSIRFISPVLTFASTEAPRFVNSFIPVNSSLGDVSTLLPYRFALVGQRPSGTS